MNCSSKLFTLILALLLIHHRSQFMDY